MEKNNKHTHFISGFHPYFMAAVSYAIVPATHTYHSGSLCISITQLIRIVPATHTHHSGGMPYGYVNGKLYEHPTVTTVKRSPICFSDSKNNENFSESIDSKDDITDHTISALPCMPVGFTPILIKFYLQ
jgi:hypothetical protein